MYKGVLRQKDKKKVTKEKKEKNYKYKQARQTKQRLMLASRGDPERKEAVFYWDDTGTYAMRTRCEWEWLGFLMKTLNC